MLGITTADAVGIGTVAAAILAAYLGSKQGKEEKKIAPPEPSIAMIGTAIVDRETLRDLTQAVEFVGKALMAGIASNEKLSHEETVRRLEEIKDEQSETAANMRALMTKLDQMPVQKHPPARRE